MKFDVYFGLKSYISVSPKTVHEDLIFGIVVHLIEHILISSSRTESIVYGEN